MEILKAIEILEKHNFWRRDNSMHPKTEMVNPTELGIAIDEVISQLNKLLIPGINCCKPTSFEKNNLPDDVKYAFNEGIDIYQAILNYENGIIDRAEFIEKVRKIKNAYLI
jgi:hypothetical protein